MTNRSAQDYLYDNTRRAIAGEWPVYANGYKLGYFKLSGVADLCRQSFYIYTETPKPIPAPALWYTFDEAQKQITVSDFCRQKGVAPSWTPTPTVAQPGTSANPLFSLPSIEQALFPDGASIIGVNWKPLAIVGGGALVLFLLLRR